MLPHEILQKYFAKKKAAAPSFTLRSLARKLAISPSFLSRVLSGKKSVPGAILPKLGAELDIEPEVLSGLTQGGASLLAPRSRGRRPVKTSLRDWELAEPATQRVLRHWFYLPILECTTLADYDGKTETVARRLGLSLAVVDAAFRELRELGLLAERGGRWVKSRKKLRWGSAKSLPAVRGFHDQMLARAQAELRREGAEGCYQKRLITGITVTTSPEQISGAKLKLAEFLHALANELSDGEGTEVYQLAAQLFPLTRS